MSDRYENYSGGWSAGEPHWGSPSAALAGHISDQLRRQFQEEARQIATKGGGKGKSKSQMGYPAWGGPPAQHGYHAEEGPPYWGAQYPVEAPPDGRPCSWDAGALSKTEQSRNYLRSLPDTGVPDGVDLTGWPTGHDERASRSMAAVLRYRSPEGWGPLSLAKELELPLQEIQRVVACSRSDRGLPRFRCVREPEGHLVLFARDRSLQVDPDTKPLVVRDKDGQPTIVPRPAKRGREERGRPVGRAPSASGASQTTRRQSKRRTRAASAAALHGAASQQGGPPRGRSQQRAAQALPGQDSPPPAEVAAPRGEVAALLSEADRAILYDENGRRRTREPLAGRTRDQLPKQELDLRTAANRERALRKKAAVRKARETLRSLGLGAPPPAQREAAPAQRGGDPPPESPLVRTVPPNPAEPPAAGGSAGSGLPATARGRCMGVFPLQGGPCILYDFEMGGPSTGIPGRTVGDSPDGRGIWKGINIRTGKCLSDEESEGEARSPSVGVVLQHAIVSSWARSGSPALRDVKVAGPPGAGQDAAVCEVCEEQPEGLPCATPATSAGGPRLATQDDQARRENGAEGAPHGGPARKPVSRTEAVAESA